MMKLWRFAKLLIALVALIVLTKNFQVAQAQDYYFRYVTPPPAVTCLTSRPDFINLIDATQAEYNLPTGASYVFYETTNGITSTPASGPLRSGTGILLLSSYGVVLDSYPIVVELRYDTLIDGRIVYSSVLRGSCTADGTGMAEVISGAVISGGGSAIRDGRINPENYAPVALYCDGSVLTAYAIDGAGGGTLAWDFDFKRTSTDNPMISQLGIALSKTEDGRYDVLAPQHDGKQYLFVFDGCPAPGRTEVYISDPASGQFIQAE